MKWTVGNDGNDNLEFEWPSSGHSPQSARALDLLERRKSQMAYKRNRRGWSPKKFITRLHTCRSSQRIQVCTDIGNFLEY